MARGWVEKTGSFSADALEGTFLKRGALLLCSGSVSRSVSQSVSQSASQSVSLSVNQSIGQSFQSDRFSDRNMLTGSTVLFDPPNTVHVYARVHSSIYIFIYTVMLIQMCRKCRDL